MAQNETTVPASIRTTQRGVAYLVSALPFLRVTWFKKSIVIGVLGTLEVVSNSSAFQFFRSARLSERCLSKGWTLVS